MATAAYDRWVSAGRPYRLCRPAAALQRALRAHGLTVYDYPDESHLRAATPEDHTPFSVTGWPVASRFGVGHGIDVMPRTDTAGGRRENATIARRLIADRNAGVPAVMWIKYLNWTDEAGICRQERWMPNHTTRSSTDRGHIHVSARSDCDDDARAEHYDPMGDDMEQSEKLNPPYPKAPALTVGNAFNIAVETREGLWVDAAATGYGPPRPGSALGMILDKLNQVIAAVGDGGVSDEQAATMADRIADVLVQRPDNPLGDADKPVIVAAVKQALAEGTGPDVG